jgi:hypothetical protein
VEDLRPDVGIVTVNETCTKLTSNDLDVSLKRYASDIMDG